MLPCGAEIPAGPLTNETLFQAPLQHLQACVGGEPANVSDLWWWWLLGCSRDFGCRRSEIHPRLTAWLEDPLLTIRVKHGFGSQREVGLKRRRKGRNSTVIFPPFVVLIVNVFVVICSYGRC